MPINKKNIFQDIEFNILTSELTEVIKSAVEKYWEQDVAIIFQAINNFRDVREERLCSNVDFFSSQIKVETHKPVTIRLSKDFVKNFLDSALGNRGFNFSLTSLSNLEVKILNNFCEFLYKRLKEILIPPQEAKLSEKSEKNINFLFYLSFNNDCCSQIMLTIPQDRVKIPPIKKQQNFKDEDFLTSTTNVRIKAGSSKITLSDLKNLAREDIVLLEASDATKLTLISGDFEKKFNVKVNPSIVMKLDNNDQEFNNDDLSEVSMEKNLWDDIQIEINAEFEKVKMTIGELKQITQGQVVDLGSVFDNEISLYVEEKKVAKGELIIINDRYAVRLNEVLSTTKQQVPQRPIPQRPQGAVPQRPQGVPPQRPQGAVPRPAQAKPMPQAQAKVPPRPQAKPAPKPQPQPKPSEDEEFDYSDFEK